MPTVPAIDGLRAYAILGVVLIHVLLASGYMGAIEGTSRNLILWSVLGNSIDFFFIISGFVLFLPILARSGSVGGLGRYARGRAARLLPAYWASLILLLVLIVLVPPSEAVPPVSGSSVIANFTALQMPAQLFDINVSIGFGINGALWMISVIVGFYVVLPLIAPSYARHPLIGLALAATIALGWRELSVHGIDVVGALADPDKPVWTHQLMAADQLPGWAFSFAVGMTGAWAYRELCLRRDLESLRRPALIALPIAVLVYAAFAFSYGQSAAEMNSAVSGSFARLDPLQLLGGSLARGALIAAIALGPLLVQRPFVNRPLARLAELSYSVYLLHLIVITYAVGLLTLPAARSAEGLVPWLAFVAGVSLPLAYLFRRFIEQPVVERVRRRERVQRGTITGGVRPLPRPAASGSRDREPA